MYIVHVISFLLNLLCREVNSLIVLVTTPKYANSTHDPLKYMDQLIHIADYSKYQKLLSWEPLFVLDNIVPEQYQYNIGDSITLTFRFHYYGPKVSEYLFVHQLQLHGHMHVHVHVHADCVYMYMYIINLTFLENFHFKERLIS